MRYKIDVFYYFYVNEHEIIIGSKQKALQKAFISYILYKSMYKESKLELAKNDYNNDLTIRFKDTEVSIELLDSWIKDFYEWLNDTLYYSLKKMVENNDIF